jgi:hypothetical protein
MLKKRQWAVVRPLRTEIENNRISAANTATQKPPGYQPVDVTSTRYKCAFHGSCAPQFSYESKSTDERPETKPNGDRYTASDKISQ